jgi:hypothetical protein
VSDTPTRHLAAADDRATAVFVRHRELLFSVV